MLTDARLRASLDGCRGWMDDVFIEWLWRSRKYKCVFINAFETSSEAHSGIGFWNEHYNRRPPHSVFTVGRPTRSMLQQK
jgi:putative transposase